jgi:hypothetical protein
VWQSHQEVTGARRRTIWAAVVLGLVAVMWLPVFWAGDSAATGGVILEVFTVVPLVLVLNRLRRLNAQVRTMKALGVEEQEAAAIELRRVDETLLRIARLTAQLPPGVPERTGNETFRTAEHASHAWRQLLLRHQEIEQLLATTKSAKARRSLQESLVGCRADEERLQSQVEELAAALVSLVDSAQDVELAAQVARDETAGDRVEALAHGCDTVNELTRLRITD